MTSQIAKAVLAVADHEKVQLIAMASLSGGSLRSFSEASRGKSSAPSAILFGFVVRKHLVSETIRTTWIRRISLVEKAYSDEKIVLTGGPCAGKTTLTQVIAQVFRHQVALCPRRLPCFFRADSRGIGLSQKYSARPKGRFSTSNMRWRRPIA